MGALRPSKVSSTGELILIMMTVNHWSRSLILAATSLEAVVISDPHSYPQSAVSVKGDEQEDE